MSKKSYRRTVLPSGLRIVSEYAPGVKSVSVGIWIDVGSRFESLRINGLSHLIEHMTFKGTSRRTSQQIVHEFESRGGSVNAFTSREQTCYYAKVLHTHLASAVDVLADIVVDSIYDPAELAREQKVIVEEIKDVRDTPSDWVHDLFAEVQWGRQDLGLPILGLKSSVQRARREDIVAFRKQHYRAGNMVVAASGALQHDRLVRMVAPAFERLNPSRPRPSRAPRAHFRGGMRVFLHPSQQTHLIVGFDSLPYVDTRKFPLLVLQQLFGGGMSSRLFQTVREQLGLAYSVYSFQDSYRDCGVFGFYIGTDPRSARRALQASGKELVLLKRGQLTKAEVASAKEQLKGQLVLGLEGTSSRMNRLARQELYTGKHVTLEETLGLIDRVSRDDLVALANDLVHFDRMTAVALGPLESGFFRGFDWTTLG